MVNRITNIPAVLFFILFVAASFNTYAWRTTPESTVTDIVPFDGGFDVRPTNMSGIPDCTSYVRVQLNVNNFTEADVNRYLSIILAAHATGKPLTFLINDNNCNVYRLILK